MAGFTATYGAGNDDVFVVRCDTDGYTQSQNVGTTFDALDVADLDPEVPVLRMGPVPVTDRLELTCDRMMEGVSVLDLAGRVVYRSFERGRVIELHMELPSGGYVLVVELMDGRTLRRPLILQRP